MCSTAPPNLVVMMSFNPPVITIIGPIKEKTVEHLNVLLPSVCTTSKEGRKGAPTFQKKITPATDCPHWQVELRGQYCDQVGISSLFSALFDSLDEEGMGFLEGGCYFTMQYFDLSHFFGMLAALRFIILLVLYLKTKRGTYCAEYGPNRASFLPLCST